MKMIKKYRFLISIIVILSIIISCIIIYFNLTFNKQKDLSIDNNIISYDDNDNDSNLKDEIIVDIKGAVKNPDVYIGNSDERVIDIINKAGGLLENADTSVINLSKKIHNEMVIIVYTKDEIQKMLSNKLVLDKENIITEKEILFPEIRNDAIIEENNDNSSKIEDEELQTENELTEKIEIVNINTATVEELEKLPGIGNSKAQNIVDYRTTNGLFENIEEIMNVTGIGTSIYEKIKSYIKI